MKSSSRRRLRIACSSLLIVITLVAPSLRRQCGWKTQHNFIRNFPSHPPLNHSQFSEIWRMTNNEVENYILRRRAPFLRTKFILVRTSSLSLRESIDTFFLGFSDSCSRSPTRSPLASVRQWIAAAESLKSAVVLHARFAQVSFLCH